MPTPAIVSESPAETDALTVFLPEDEASKTSIVPLHEFSAEEGRHTSASPASGTASAPATETAADADRAATWQTTSQAGLKVGFRQIADSLGLAVRGCGRSVTRCSVVTLAFAGATLSALVARASAFTRHPVLPAPRTLATFVCGAVVGAIIALSLTLRSDPGSTPASQPASAATAQLDSFVPTASSPVNARAAGAGVEPTGTTSARPESDQAVTSLLSSSAGDEQSAEAASFAPRAGYRGSLAVNSMPTGARVLVNGVQAGTTPLVLRNLPVGSRVVRVELDGYQAWSSAVSVVANQRVRAEATLQSSNPTR